MTEGVPIAVLRPKDGSLVKVIRAVLPTAVWMRTSGNPSGFVFPSHGSADDRLVIMDRSVDIVGIY